MTCYHFERYMAPQLNLKTVESQMLENCCTMTHHSTHSFQVYSSNDNLPHHIPQQQHLNHSYFVITLICLERQVYILNLHPLNRYKNSNILQTCTTSVLVSEEHKNKLVTNISVRWHTSQTQLHFKLVLKVFTIMYPSIQ